MVMKKPESVLREIVAKALDSVFHLTWHETKDVAVGTPDFSMVAKSGPYETGWVELKAIPEPLMPTMMIEVRRAQHTWLRTHHSLVPAFILIQVGSQFFLLPGSSHSLLANRVTLSMLRTASILWCDGERSLTMRLAAFLLKQTDRYRDVE